MTDVGRTLGGRYQLGDVIGHGGMAEVHAGSDIRLGRNVAIKVLRADLARDPAFLTRFRREAQSAAGLNHPNIVAIYDTGEDDFESGLNQVKVPWIVMERVDGVTLRQVLSSGRKISPERALDIIDGVLAALDYSHRHGIVHRDIKPANIMITQAGNVKVMDFGIARAMADSATTVTNTNAVMGTAQYLSPEQARGEIVDARSDLYSTGCMLYELLTGKAPFTGDSPVGIAYQHVSTAPIPPSEVNPAIPKQFDTLVLNALAKKPDDRYPTAADMRSDLQRLLAGQDIDDHTMVLDRTQRIPVITETEEDEDYDDDYGRPPRRSVLIGIGAAILALVVGAIIVVPKLVPHSSVTQVQVPDLSGLAPDRAGTVLQGLGLVIGHTTYETSADRPANTIISQNPAPDASVDKGSAVDVVISKGKDQVQVPTLANFLSPDDARTALMAVGLTLGSVTFEDSDKPANQVLRSDPIAGTYVDSGTAVAIVVSSGKVKIPDVKGMTEAAAKDALYNLGFTTTSVTQIDDTVAAGTVIGMSPSAGKSVQQGTTITLTVSVLPPDPTDTAANPNP